MKWFFALNECGNQFENYSKLLKVAVHTARKFTSLEPYFLYDGEENSLIEWLKKRGVNVINCRTFLYEKLKKIAQERCDPNYLGIGAGAFLRTEIPRLTAEVGITDQYVLYTDVDVMFLSEVTDVLSNMFPQYFATAPESSLNNYNSMNSGVMLMNLETLRKTDAKFRDFMSEKIEKLVDMAWDQGAYKRFYKSRFFGFKWDKLPPEFNWKPYWHENPVAKIIHFHGPKPYQKEVLAAPNVPEHLKILLPFRTENYQKLCRLWDDFYKEVESEN